MVTATDSSKEPAVERTAAADLGRLRIAEQAGPELLIFPALPDLAKALAIDVTEDAPVRAHHHATGLDLAVVRQVGRLERPVTPGLAFLPWHATRLLEARKPELDLELFAKHDSFGEYALELGLVGLAPERLAVRVLADLAVATGWVGVTEGVRKVLDPQRPDPPLGSEANEGGKLMHIPPHRNEHEHDAWPLRAKPAHDLNEADDVLAHALEARAVANVLVGFLRRAVEGDMQPIEPGAHELLAPVWREEHAVRVEAHANPARGRVIDHP